jgi:hypothetical protein
MFTKLEGISIGPVQILWDADDVGDNGTDGEGTGDNGDDDSDIVVFLVRVQVQLR